MMSDSILSYPPTGATYKPEHTADFTGAPWIVDGSTVMSDGTIIAKCASPLLAEFIVQAANNYEYLVDQLSLVELAARYESEISACVGRHAVNPSASLGIAENALKVVRDGHPAIEDDDV